ncbi:MAG: hypothetical protein AAGF27_01245 [Pseudomonadota bacterium]
MTYCIQTFSLAAGWTNTWTDIDPQGVEHPVTFETREEAEVELAEFLSARGLASDDYRIVNFSGVAA